MAATNRNRPVLVETQCAFCPFVAVSSDLRIVEFAEVTHDCHGLHEYRQEQARGA